MKFSKFILISVLIISCSSTQSVTGLYGKCEKDYFACTQLELKTDKTFEYFIFMDVGGASVIKGNWKQTASDSIVLNTFKQPKHPITTYTGKINSETTENIKITIKEAGFPLTAATVVINNNQGEGKAANTDGVVEFEAQKIHTITYHFLHESETIAIDNPNFNEIEITIKDLDSSAVPTYLTDEVMILKNKRLFINESHSLKKTNMKNKQWK